VFNIYPTRLGQAKYRYAQARRWQAEVAPDKPRRQVGITNRRASFKLNVKLHSHHNAVQATMIRIPLPPWLPESGDVLSYSSVELCRGWTGSRRPETRGRLALNAAS
jgi:hypothetical protein